MAKTVRIRNEEFKEYQKHYNRNLRQTYRKEFLSFLGGKCVVCGWDDWRALQVDHIHGGGNIERKTKGRPGFGPYDYKKLMADPATKEKFQILCANHNWVKKYENSEY